ncbi:MAG: enoyl-CoA hydratase-related protein [Candidatus Thermoplasmatota archaeon]|nr:enoyl-CoA hydratase-related protein [Candidatus Thermoplasmatota archaeon]
MAGLSTHVDDHVLTLTLDRPARMNCIDGALADALEAAWTRFHQDDDLRVAILTGAGQEAFCSGADLDAVDELGPGGHATEAEREAFLQDGTGYLGGTRFTHIDKPILAAINGHCLAGGLELACLADLRIAEAHATFGVTCRRWNVPLVDGGTQRLPRIVGLGHAMDLILTGRTIEAQEAHRMGLVNEIVEPGQALPRCREIAELLAQHPQEAMRADKASVLQGLGRPRAEGRALAARGGEAVITSQAFRDGIARFSQRER